MAESFITPVIFLDIHGVLLLKSGDAPEDAYRALRDLVLETGALIVITSNLRCGRSVEDLRLMMCGLAGRHVGYQIIGKTGEDDIPRGELIAAWREENGHDGPYVIIDNDCTVEPRSKAICVKGAIGLTSDEAEQAFHILKG
jgi:hypothetical protein